MTSKTEQANEPETKPKSSVLAALHAVMEKVGYVEKRGENKFHHYKYAGEGDLLKVLRPAMVEAGLLLIPSVANLSGIDEYGNVNVTMEYTLAHKDGEVWPEKITIIGTGNDKNSKGGVGDKGTYKAMTGANKYLLFKLFQIETGDDPEKTESPAPAPANRGQKLHGPLKVTELKAKMRDFAGDLAAVSDETELVAMLNSYQGVLDQCQRDLPDWWFGNDGDVAGAMGRIEDRRKELQDTEPVYDGKPEAETAPAIEIEVPAQPGLIPVPAPSNGADMKVVWQTWCIAFLAAIDACEDVSAVNAWMKANVDPLKNLNVSSKAAYQHLENTVKAKRGTLAQAPVTEAAE